MAKTKVWPGGADTTVINNVSSGVSSGAGKDEHLMVGRWNDGSATRVGRGIIEFTESWTGVVRMLKAELVLRYNDPPYHDPRGSTPKDRVRRLTSALGGVGTGDHGGWTTDGVHWDTQPSNTSTNQSATKSLPTAGSDKEVRHDITNLVGDIAPTTVEVPLVGGGGYEPGRNGGTFRGVVILADDESNTNRYHEYLSGNAGSTYDPYIELTYEDNLAPTAPIDLEPTGDAVVLATSVATTGRPTGADGSTTVQPRGTVTFQGTFQDPDAGDTLDGAYLEVYEDDGVTLAIGGEWTTSGDGDPVGVVWNVAMPGVPTGRFLKWRGRNYDQDFAEGAWSPLQRFWANGAPGAPISLSVNTDSLTPTFRGTISDPDGGTMGAAWVQVRDPSTLENLWDSGWMSQVPGTVRFVETYSTSATGLQFGVPVQWRAKVQDDQGQEGPYTAWQSLTPVEVLGPSNMTPRDTNTKVDTLTPSLSIAHLAAFDFYELEVYDNPDGIGTPLWDVPLTSMASATSKVVVYAGAPLAWGRTYWWRARIRNTSTLVYAPETSITEAILYPFYVNSLPAAPVLTVDGEV